MDAAVLWTRCMHEGAHHFRDLTWTGACVILVSGAIGFLLGMGYKKTRHNSGEGRDD